jgi:hypothetical protein
LTLCLLKLMMAAQWRDKWDLPFSPIVFIPCTADCFSLARFIFVFVTTLISRPCDKLKTVFRYAGPRPKDAETPLLKLRQFILSNYTLQLPCLQRAPGCRVTEKSQLFHTNRRAGPNTVVPDIYVPFFCC